MTSEKHAVIGALIGAGAALAPDLALACFGWRSEWVDESDPLVRVHRVLHSKRMLIWTAALAFASHIVIDLYSPHRKQAYETDVARGANVRSSSVV